MCSARKSVTIVPVSSHESEAGVAPGSSCGVGVRLGRLNVESGGAAAIEGEPNRRVGRDTSTIQRLREIAAVLSDSNNDIQSRKSNGNPNIMAQTERLDAALASVQSAAIDGRMRNVRTRQKQLVSLFKSLTKHASSFIDALQKDNSLTKEEANIVVSAMLLEVRQHYDNIDFKKELAQEYNVRWGKSWAGRRVAVPLVYIVPQDFTKGFNVFSALSAAIEAGSCCVVEVRDAIRVVTGTRSDQTSSYPTFPIKSRLSSGRSWKPDLTKKLS